MSADNYIFVSKQADGRFAVSHRYASVYYEDECDEPPTEGYSFTGSNGGWTINGDSKNKGVIFQTLEDAEKAATRRPDWIVAPPSSRSVHDTLEEAVMAAHKYVSLADVVEYGVIVQANLLEQEVK